MTAEPLWQALMGRFPAHGVPFAGQPPESGERTLALVLAYEGSGFAGWQVQPKERTVQGALEAALGRLCDHPVRVIASGRTDAGVHAWGQVAHFTTTSGLDLKRMARGLGALLPPGILVRALGPVAPKFHARFGAKAKTYDYFLWPGATAPLFLGSRLWATPHSLDPAPVAEALSLCLGDKDMAALACNGCEVTGSTVRRILGAELSTCPSGIWRIRLTATGFLRHAVRNLVGALSQVGQGRLAPADLAEMLAAGRRLYAGPKAPPQGLYLCRVYYADNEWEGAAGPAGTLEGSPKG